MELGRGAGWVGFKRPSTNMRACVLSSRWRVTCHQRPAPGCRVWAGWSLAPDPQSASWGPWSISKGLSDSDKQGALLWAVSPQPLEVAVSSQFHFSWRTRSPGLPEGPRPGIIMGWQRAHSFRVNSFLSIRGRAIVPRAESLAAPWVLLPGLFSLRQPEWVFISLSPQQLASLCMAVWGYSFVVLFFFLIGQIFF